jgi:RNA methyltransferase, TrmH family
MTADSRSGQGRSPALARPRRLDHATDEAIHAARLLKTPQGRRRQGRFLLEGVRLVEDALSQGVYPVATFLTPHLIESTARGHDLALLLNRLDAPVYELSERHLTLVADTETPAGVVVVADLPLRVDALPEPNRPGLSVLLLDQIRDPGNIGGILRTAAAGGLSAVVSTEGSADLWAPKVVRAGAGAHFRLPLYPGWPLLEVAAWLATWPQLVVADARARNSIYDIDWSIATILTLSNEARGASSWLDRLHISRTAIPMQSDTESLNVAAAAAVIVYEARRSFLRQS